MLKQNKRRTKRIKNLIVITALTAVIISVSTYAWFIGMRTVHVSSFDVEIAATDSLLLSLDGEKWDTTVSISKETHNDATTTDGNPSYVYTSHSNNWAGRGLIPMSSIGDMDTTASRMKLYEKASLTATPGGYRLLASRVHNYEQGNPEQDGYVVFDLFVRNFSGTQYLPVLNELDEEAIYLTVDSAVTVALEGGVANTGIENSVRVAFAQIGRVSGFVTTPATITGITCEPNGSGIPSVKGDVTGICRTAQIWEPNDEAHVANAISWYNTSCKARTKVDVTNPESYSGACGTVANGTSYPTYAVSTAITSADNVDVYDGAEYNKYTGTTKLAPYPYFTDAMKLLTGVARPSFMTLAPNSITKVRIYIYIEGQDVDNYDFASIGKKISVKFGFTKERFTEDDFDYTGEIIDPNEDMVKPVIVLNGEANVEVAKGSVYKDLGATASDNIDGDITTKIQTINPVKTSVPGTYYVTYDVSDWTGNYADRVTRTVVVKNE